MWAVVLAVLRAIGAILVARNSAKDAKLQDLQQAEQIHHDATASRGPIADPDTVLRNAGRLRSD